MSIQDTLDGSSGTISLPEGTYEGPVVIRHPCVVTGHRTTIWSGQGAAVCVESQGVTLRRLRIHVLGGQGVSVRTTCSDTVLADVELNGAVSGFPGERADCALPSLFRIGPFACYPAENQILFPLDAPSRLRLSSTLRGVSLSTDTLSPGHNEIVLTIRNIDEGRTLYGPLLVAGENGVIRRIYLSGQAVSGVPPRTLPPGAAVVRAPQGIISGDHRPVPARRFAVRLDPPPPAAFDVEPIVLLLGRNMRVRGDDDLIFFHNRQSASGGVTVEEDEKKCRTVRVDLDRVEEETPRILICYAIMSESAEHRFDRLRGLSLRLGGEKAGEAVFPLERLREVKNLLGIQIYRRQGTGEWKVFYEGQGYSMDLASLCKNYGVNVQ